LPPIFACFSYTHTEHGQVLENDQFLGKSGPRTLFAIECESAVDITRYANFGEAEVLLFPATTIQIVSVADLGGGLTLVTAVEVKTPMPVLCDVCAWRRKEGGGGSRARYGFSDTCL
jgi:hypothetical protein